MTTLSNVLLHATVDVARAEGLVAGGAEPVLADVVASFAGSLDVEDGVGLEANMFRCCVFAEGKRINGESSLVDIFFRLLSLSIIIILVSRRFLVVIVVLSSRSRAFHNMRVVVTKFLSV